MTRQQAKKRIEKLKKVITYHRYLYHVLDKQEISDAAFDSLKHELYQLEEKFPEFITPDSPTQRVGGEPLKEFKKVGHKIPMLSIEDVFTKEELKKWEDYLKRLIPSAKFEYFSEMKIDGFAITLIYKNGLFVTGATRGNGRIGEDVTQNLKTIESIPLKLEIHGKLPTKEIEENLKRLIEKGEIEIRGEVYMGKKEFEEFNEKQRKRGEATYSNPRNLAAGSIRQLDPKLSAIRPLTFLAYDMVTDLSQTKHSEEHQILPVLGFKTNQGRICKNLEEIVEYWRDIAKKRDTLPLLIDGVVINVNDNSLFQELGVVGKSPRGVRAFKFSPKQATTIVRDIKVQIGRTGAVTPVAHLKPVQVGGVKISRATLHNAAEIKRLGVKIGDTVIIERAGDVIPAVVKVLPKLRTGREKVFFFPQKCPICGAKLQKSAGEAVWRCKNSDCGARKREFLYYFASKKAFDIEGLGPQIINKLLDAGLISEVVDLFNLKEGDLISLESLPRRKPKAFLRGFAEKSSKNLIEAIKESKKISLSRFIFSLGIRHIGEETAIVLSNYFGSIEKFKKASQKTLEEIPHVGRVVSKTIYDWFQQKRNQKLINDLIKAGVEILSPEKIGKKLAGKTFVLTGTLKSLTRREAERKIRMFGGHSLKFPSKQTSYVLVGRNPGSKLKKAEKLGVRIIGEKEFLEMIK